VVLISIIKSWIMVVVYLFKITDTKVSIMDLK